MALIALYHRSYGNRRHQVRIVDDSGTFTKRFVVPNPLPEGFSTNGGWIKSKIKKQILVMRRRADKAAAKAAEAALWDSYTDTDTSAVLAELQAELDS